MTLSKTEVQQQLLSALVKGFFCHGRKVDQFGPLLDIEECSGKYAEWVVFSEANLPSAAFATAGAAPAQDDATPDAANRTAEFYRVLLETVIRDYYADAYVGDQNFVDIQRIACRLGIDAVIRETLIIGDNGSNPQEFDGLVQMATDSGNTVGADGDNANGGALNLNDVDRAIDLITANYGRPDYLIMNSNVKNDMLSLMRTAGWDPRMEKIEKLNILAPCYLGIPMLVDNYIPETYSKGTGNNLTYLFCANLGWGRGLSLVAPQGRKEHLVQEHEYRKDGADDLILRFTTSIGLALFQDGALSAVDGIAPT